MDELADSLRELAAAQKKTEAGLLSLVGVAKTLQVQMGGLSNAVGYRLENEAIRALPAILKREHGIEVEGRLERRFVECGAGRFVEVNILGRGKRAGKVVLILGEAKVQLSKDDVNRFARSVAELHAALGGDEVFPFLVADSTHPRVQEAADRKGLRVVASYELG
ncbi:MAG: hypothetical protein HYZ53_29390 [Planctomycetes bacterium]|nr:hypothetical protein [Planctomycetota bacterium]